MTVEELVNRFPEVPQDLHGEPLMAEFARECGDLLELARKPSACSQGHDAANHYYLKLLGPVSIYGYGLFSREKVLSHLREMVERRRADPEGFAASLLPPDLAAAEVRGPGCP